MTDTERQTAAAEAINTAAAPGIDWRAVVGDMANEHVARLAVDASMLRVELNDVKRSYQRLIIRYERIDADRDEARREVEALTVERDSLITQLEEAQVPAVVPARRPAKKAPARRTRGG
jgi:hypothetical protein